MCLDQTKLNHVRPRGDGSFTAQCPACRGAGGDSKGMHLIVFANGAYGCVAAPEDAEHSKEIFKLVGLKSKRGAQTLRAPKPIKINRVQ